MSGSGSFKVALVGHSDPHVPAWVEKALAEAGVVFVHDQCDTPTRLIDLAGDADVVWSFGSNPAFTAETWRDLLAQALDGFARCGVILRAGSGTDNIPVSEATKAGILVANTPGATAEPVAEYTVTLMLAAARRLVDEADRARRGDWSQPAAPTATSLRDKTLGLVGFGQIAQLVAHRVAGFDMRIVASDPYAEPAVMRSAGVEPLELEALLEQADVVSLHCPLTDATRHLIGEAELRRMKPNALLINTSRGAVIEESALIRALGEGWIAGAGLDVLEHEPAPADHPLLSMDRVIVTPHVAAFSEQIFIDMWRLSVETILELKAGRWPPSCVNPEVRDGARWSLAPCADAD